MEMHGTCPDKIELSKVKPLLLEAKRIYIFIGPADADALGSALALQDILTHDRPREICRIYSKWPLARNHPLCSRISQTQSVSDSVDVMISLDAREGKDLGASSWEAFRRSHFPATLRVNIDHHSFNSHFADLNVVEPKASSTAEVLYGFVVGTLGCVIPPLAASNLLMAILAETEALTLSNTGPNTLDVVSGLSSRVGL